jgi:hypothetical protein
MVANVPAHGGPSVQKVPKTEFKMFLPQVERNVLPHGFELKMDKLKRPKLGDAIQI